VRDLGLIIIFGPPAVGKMAVGLELSKIIGYKLFLNHDSIELLLKFFDYGTEKFNKLDWEFRRHLFEEIADSELPGLIFTYVTAMNDESEKVYLKTVSEIFTKHGKEVYYIELEATLSERLKRNKEESRILAKPSKRDTVASERRLLIMEKKYIMNSSEEYPFYFDKNYLKINNTDLSPKDAAIKIANTFNLKKLKNERKKM